jgi:hypothetical protein
MENLEPSSHNHENDLHTESETGGNVPAICDRSECFDQLSVPQHCTLLPRVNCSFQVVSDDVVLTVALPINCLFTPLPCLFTSYFLSIPCLFPAYFLSSPYLSTAHSLHIHCIFTAYFLPIHCLHVFTFQFTADGWLHRLHTPFTMHLLLGRVLGRE